MIKPSTLFSSLIGIAFLLLAAHPTRATNRTVFSTGDAGSGTLRDAINASADGDTIDFAIGPTTISLTSGELLITHNITINGPGARVLTVARNAGAASFFRIFEIGLANTVAVSGLTISSGHLQGGNNSGGGIYNNGALSLNDCVLSGNVVNTSGVIDYGGGVYNNGTLAMANCTLSNNLAGSTTAPNTFGYGGGIYNIGTLTMTNCTVSANTASGASAVNNSGELGDGGAIFNASTLTLTNCTISGNSATAGIANNTYAHGGGIFQFSLVNPTLRNTIVAGNTVSATGGSSAAFPDVYGIFDSQGHNLVGDTNGSSGWVATDKTDANAVPLNLGFLQNFGGQTQVRPLLAGSVAIDAGDDSVTGPPLNLATDQRGPGFPRSLGAHVDIGAFEFNPMFIVTTISDGDDGACDFGCTLREAINAANTAPGDNTITFAPGVSSTIQLDGALPNLSTNMTIRGPGANILAIRRNSSDIYRIFTISNGTSTGPTANITGLTISNGVAPANGNFPNDGGGILNDSSTINVSKCVITSNSAGYGGATFNFHGSLTLTDSTIIGNQVTTSSGAIYNYGSGGAASLTVSNSTFNGNIVTGPSGGAGVMDNYGGTATFTNCTFYNNSGFGAGVIYNNGIATTASLILHSCTLSFNLTGSSTSGDILNSASFGGTATLTLSNTIFKKGGQGQNLLNNGGTVISEGYNLSSDAAGGDGGTGPGGLLNATGDIRNSDPLLGTLSNNGGPTLTVALLSGSPAINNGAPTAPLQDQRYYLRFGAPDIGAFEFGGALAPVNAVSRKAHGASSFDVNLPLVGAVGIECRSGGGTDDYQLVMSFATSVTVQNFDVTSGTGTASGASNDAHGHVTIFLTGVTNAQRIVITLFGVSDGTNMGDVAIPMGVLLGDTNGNGFVSASDVGQTKAQSGQTTTEANFRTDVNVSGSISAADIGLVKSKSGTSLP